MSGRNDKFTSYEMLVDQVNDEKADKRYIIGERSRQQGSGMFEEDAVQVMKENPRFDRLVHAKIYLCALMDDLPITDKDVKSTVERIDEVNRENLDDKSYEVLLRLK